MDWKVGPLVLTEEEHVQSACIMEKELYGKSRIAIMCYYALICAVGIWLRFGASYRFLQDLGSGLACMGAGLALVYLDTIDNFRAGMRRYLKDPGSRLTTEPRSYEFTEEWFAYSGESGATTRLPWTMIADARVIREFLFISPTTLQYIALPVRELEPELIQFVERTFSAKKAS